MLERISFQLANNRGRYSHFIHLDGNVASLYPKERPSEYLPEGDLFKNPPP